MPGHIGSNHPRADLGLSGGDKPQLIRLAHGRGRQTGRDQPAIPVSIPQDCAGRRRCGSLTRQKNDSGTRAGQDRADLIELLHPHSFLGQGGFQLLSFALKSNQSFLLPGNLLTDLAYGSVAECKQGGEARGHGPRQVEAHRRRRPHGSWERCSRSARWRGGGGRGFAFQSGHQQFAQVRGGRHGRRSESQLARNTLILGNLRLAHRAALTQVDFKGSSLVLAERTQRVQGGSFLSFLCSLVVIQSARGLPATLAPFAPVPVAGASRTISSSRAGHAS